MVKILNKPHFFFFSLIPISLIIGLILNNQTLDFAYYGGAISFNYFSIFSISAVFFALIGLNYFSLILLKKQPKKWLTLFHIILQILSFVILTYYAFAIKNTETEPQKELLTLMFFIGFILFLISVLIHLLSFFISLLIKTE